ncbi:hypothetical protein ACTXT7_005603 [Hymenolepis weldensis]
MSAVFGWSLKTFSSCCLLSNPQKYREIDNITLEGIANEYRKFDTKCDSGLNQKKFGEHNYVNRISSEIVSGNISALRKTLIEYWLHFVRANVIFATYVANKVER